MQPQQMDQFFDRGKVASSGAVHGIVLWKESFVNKLLVCSHGALMSCLRSIEQLKSPTEKYPI